MTPHEQLLLELVNRARSNPSAEAALYGINLNEGLSAGTITTSTKQPLAPNQILVDASGAHSADMIANDYFDHTNLNNQSPSARALAAGYPVGVAENISYGGSTGSIDHEANVYDRHRRLFLSKGHRVNLLNPNHQEVGMGIRFGRFTADNGTTYNVGMATEKFGNPPGNSFLTGVVFTDAADNSPADNDFFNIGEQVSGGTITATELTSGQTHTTTIGNSGGYSLALPAGTYNVVAEGGPLTSSYLVANVALSNQNVKVDFETTTATSNSGGSGDDPPAAPDEAPATPAPIRFDFGTGTSPLEADHTRITGGTTYNATRGHGWLGGTVKAVNRSSGTPLSRDLNYKNVATFAVDVPNATYQVSLTVGDQGPSPHDQQVFLEGTLVDSVATAAGETLTRTYETEVNDGQLTILLDGRGGVDPNMVISGLEIVEVDPTPALSLSLSDTWISENGGSTTGTVTRSGDPTGNLVVTLQSSDTTEATVPATVTILNGQSSANFNVQGVDDDAADHDQAITLMAAAEGFAPVDETLTVTDDEVPEFTPLLYDFGTPTSALEPGHLRVAGSTTYNATRGYGWLGGRVNQLSRSAGTNLSRDLNFKNVATFAVDLPNGSYDVSLTVGDEGAYRHDQQISLEGTLRGSVETAKYEIVTRTYRVTVTDGQLTILLDGRGGVDPNMVISGLRIASAGG